MPHGEDAAWSKVIVTGFAKRDHIPHFPKFFKFWRFSNCHISTTIHGSEIILGTEQVLTFN